MHATTALSYFTFLLTLTTAQTTDSAPYPFNTLWNVEAGKSRSIEWNIRDESPITVILVRGPSTRLSTVTTISELTNNPGTLVWFPSKSLTNGKDYAYKIVDDGRVNYSPYFEVSGGVDAGPVTTDVAPEASKTAAELSHQNITSSPTGHPPPESETNPGRKHMIGAIVGGIVGGIAGIILIVIGIVYLCNRRSRSTKMDSRCEYKAELDGSGVKPSEAMGDIMHPVEMDTGTRDGVSLNDKKVVHELP